ncbi:MAG: hypothetical protein U9N86_02425 [Bacteroidota bacterium]|nr:hypothetical protein [Bacteroidota bacterium]
METRKPTLGTRTQQTTLVTELGSIVRLDSLYFNPFSFSFVLDETLQLIERPITDPIIHNFTSPFLPDTFQVFHYNLVSTEVGNNVFTYTVVYMLHPTSFSSAQLPEKLGSGTSAFSLKFTTQVPEFPFGLLNFSRSVKPVVGTDSKVIYSEVNTQNIVLRTIALLNGSDLFREREQKETPTFFIEPKQTFLDIPLKIFFITRRNSKFKLLPGFEQPQNQGATFKVSTSWEIVADRGTGNEGFRFSFLDHSTRLLDTSDCKLRWQPSLSEGFVDERMEFNIILDFASPSLINTELKGFGIFLDSTQDLICWSYSDFCSCNRTHKVVGEFRIYKGHGQMSSERYKGGKRFSAHS